MSTTDDDEPLFDVDSPNTPDNPDDIFRPSPDLVEYRVKDEIRFRPRFRNPSTFRVLVVKFRVYPTKPTYVFVTLTRRKQPKTRSVSIDDNN